MRHAPFVLVMAIGVVLRWIDWRAYRPALLYPDSVHYLSDAVTGDLNERRPSGYSFLLGPLVSHGDIAGIALAHHLLVLGIAILIYALMLRRGVPAWGAALASIPLLIDPLQLVLEQYVLSDVLFEALLVLACVLLLWRRRPSVIEVVAAGALLGYAALVRGAGIGLVIPAALAVASLRLGWRRVAALVAAFAVPLVLYMAAFQSQHGVFATNTYSSRYLYGRVTTFVHCHGGLRLPAYERPLCPKQSVAKRHSSDWYMWRKGSPQKHLKTPRGVTVIQALHDFDKRAIRAQPVAFARIAARDFLYGFHPSRTHSVSGFPPSRWLFHQYYWSLHGSPQTTRHFRQDGYGPFVAHRTYTRFLTSYQNVFHTPGPLLLAAALIAAVATAGAGRARESGNRVASGLFLGLCLMPLMTTAALSGFSWRYQLPQLALLGPAGALGLTALLRRPRYPLAGAESTTLHRLTTLILRRSRPAPTAEYAVGVAAAALAGLLFGAASYVTHWARPVTALVLAVGAFVAVAVLLFTSRWRGSPAPSEPPPDAVPRATDVGPSAPVASDR